MEGVGHVIPAPRVPVGGVGGGIGTGGIGGGAGLDRVGLVALCNGQDHTHDSFGVAIQNICGEKSVRT